MENFNLINFSVIIFLLINLFIGIWAGKGVKTIEDYAIGKRNWSTGALVMTYLASMLSGSDLFRGVKKFSNIGISGFASTIGILLGFAIRYYFFSDKFIKFKDCFSIGDVAQKLFGKYGKIYTGIVVSISSLLWYGIQIEILSNTLNSFLNINFNKAIIYSTLIITIYTFTGGIKSVIATDIFQFIFIVIGMFILTSSILSNSGGCIEVLNKLTDDQFHFFKPGIFPSMFSIFIIESIFLADTVGTSLLVRTILPKTVKKTKKMFLYVALGYFIFTICRFFIGIAGSQIENLEQKEIIKYVYDNFLSQNMKIFLLLGIISLTISSADTFLHASSVTLFKDLILPFYNGNNKNYLIIIKALTLFLGILGGFFVKLNLAYLDMNFLYGITTVSTIAFPFIIGIYGLKASKKAFFIAAILGFLTFIFLEFNFSGKIKDLASLFSAIVNATSYLIINFIENKGFYLEKKNEYKKII